MGNLPLIALNAAEAARAIAAGSVHPTESLMFSSKNLIMSINFGSPLEFDNQVTYWGVDFNIPAGPFEMTAQYLLREDSRPLYAREGSALPDLSDVQDIKTSGIVAEFIYAQALDKSDWYLILLYNGVDSDLDEHDYQTLSLSGTYILARNLRLLAEYTRDIECERNRLVLGIVSAF